MNTHQVLSPTELTLLRSAVGQPVSAVRHHYFTAQLDTPAVTLSFGISESDHGHLLSLTRPTVALGTPDPSIPVVATPIASISQIRLVRTLVTGTPPRAVGPEVLLGVTLPAGVTIDTRFAKPGPEPVGITLDAGIRFDLSNGQVVLLATPGITWSLEVSIGAWPSDLSWADWGMGFDLVPLESNSI